MAIIASDDFVGVTDNVAITGRTLNNGAGGSGSRTWHSAGAAALTGTGDAKVDSSGSNQDARSGVDLTGIAPAKHRVRFNPNGGTSQLCMFANRTVTGTSSGNFLMLLLVSGHTSLRVREGSSQTLPSGTDRASLTVTAPGTTFWLEMEIAGLVVTCRILNNDLSVRNQVSHTFTSLPSGTNWGFGFASSGSTGIWDDFIVEDASGGSQNLDPPLLTNGQTFYSPTVTGGASAQILAPGLLTNAQTFYSPTVAQPGVTAAYVLANTAPVGANPAGAMYEVAGLVDPGDYMTYETVSGPTPGGGTLVTYADGSFEYTGGAPAIWVIQIKINGVNYPETTTVFLYDQEFTLLPPLLTNGQTFYSPTVTGGGALSVLPPLLTNTQTFYSPTVTRVIIPGPAGEPGDKNTPSGMIGFWNR